MISEYMELHPTEPIWPFQLGRLLEARAAERRDASDTQRDYLSAASYYERAAARVPADDRAGVAQARAAQMKALTLAEQPEKALRVWESVAGEHPSPMLRLAAAQAYWAANQREDAARQWHQSLLDASLVGMGHVGAVVESLQGTVQPVDLIRLVESAAERAPAGSSAAQRLRVVLASQYGAAGELDRAILLLDEVISQAAGNTAEGVAARMARAQVHEQRGDVTAAIEDYRAVLQQGDNLYALNNLAYMLVAREGEGLPRPEEALQYAQRLESLVADNPAAVDVLDTIGWVYFRYALATPAEKREYLDRALATLEQALALQVQPSVTLLEHLGEVYAESGRRVDARQAYQRALEKAGAAGDKAAAERIQARLSSL
jgi:tetratricopeptide (TPR) repeat protein